jgi:hypothetical protein
VALRQLDIWQIPLALSDSYLNHYVVSEYIPLYPGVCFAKTGSTEGYWLALNGSTVLFAYLGNWYCHAIVSSRTHAFTALQARTVLQNIDSDPTMAGAKSKHRLAMHGCDHFMTDPEVGDNRIL